MNSHQFSRTVVVGTSCAGKTTFARALSQALEVPHTELDELYWGPDWTPRPLEEFRSLVQSAISSPTWVIDGNYSMVRDLVWKNATCVIWLNYPFSLVFRRAVVRTLRRVVSQEALFAGNRESFAITDPEWIPWWVLRTFRQRRKEFSSLLRQPEYGHLQVIELARPAEAERLLESCGT